MGWEFRNGSPYYYRKERSGGRVSSVYVGRGEIAGLAASLDEMQQREHEGERMKQRREREASQVIDGDIDSLARLTSTLTQAVLIAGGFHQHKRQWRKQKA